MREVNVKINEIPFWSYPILVGENLLSDAQRFLHKYCPASKYFVVTNKTVSKLWKKSLDIENAEFFEIPDGEKYKNFETLISILNKASELNLDRKCAFVAFGGGVVGDITGFAASIYRRGVNFVQIPTTLLAQVDSSVGGKTAVNNSFGKNLIGTFYQPKLVIADINTLSTLDERQFKTGLAEVVKYAFIEKSSGLDFNFVDLLSKSVKLIIEKNPIELEKIVEICCSIKAAVVNQDEKEQGLRAILNLGHTYGHAIEKCTNYNVYTHGEAVAVGLQVAFDISFAKGLITEDYYNTASELINVFDFIIPEHENYSPEKVLEAMKFDKKAQNGKVKFVLPNDIGKVGIYDDVNREMLLQIIS